MEELKNWKKHMAYFFGGQAVSILGSSLVSFAIIFYITNTTKSGTMMSIASMASFMPRFLISFISGVWADRYDRKKLIAFSDIFTALATLTVAICFACGYQEIWVILVCMVCRSIGSGIQGPCVGAVIPDIVPTEQLVRANSMYSTVASVIQIISPLFGAMLVKMIPIEYIFGIDVFTAIIGVGLLILIPITKHQVKESDDNTHTNNRIIQELKDGLVYIKQEKYIFTMIMFNVGLNFFFTPINMLSSLHVTLNYGEDAMYLSAVNMAIGIGMVVGGIYLSIKGDFKDKTKAISLFCLILGLCQFWMGFAPAFIIYLLLYFTIGITVPGFNAPISAMIQEKTPSQILGRVLGMLEVLSSIATPIAMVLFGPLADIIGVGTVIAIGGIANASFCIFIAKNKNLKISSVKEFAEVL